MSEQPERLPASIVADRIGELVKELLGRGIGPDENFFEAGLDSLTVVRLHTLMSRRLGTTLPVTALFTHSNVRQVAALIADSSEPQREQRTDTAVGRPRRSAVSRREIRAQIRRADEEPR
jgi:acyl carrier protein